jgi:hypothetical protein
MQGSDCRLGRIACFMNPPVIANDVLIQARVVPGVQPSGTTQYADMMKEFKIETNSFDASVGHSGGLTISMSTKSGTNRIHGTATRDYRNEEWAAAPEYPKADSNNFAGTIAGPVMIPKVFNRRNERFFFAYDGARNDIPAGPRDIERNGA